MSLAFGYPIIKIQQQSSVGGRKISGGGDKIADFVVKNSMTNNTAIIEIKTPQEKLLNAQPYREGVYTPSTELSGSINQALDQKYRFEREIAQIKENSRIHDIETYSVHCCLIIGTIPTTEDRHKSFGAIPSKLQGRGNRYIRRTLKKAEGASGVPGLCRNRISHSESIKRTALLKQAARRSSPKHTESRR